VCSAAKLSVGRDGSVYLVDYRDNSSGSGRTNYILRTSATPPPDGIRLPAGERDSLVRDREQRGLRGPGRRALRRHGHRARQRTRHDPVGQWVGVYVGARSATSPLRVEAGAVSGRFYVLAQFGLSVPGQRSSSATRLRASSASAAARAGDRDRSTCPLTFGPDEKDVLDFRVRETEARPASPGVLRAYHGLTDKLPHIAKVDQSGTLVWDRTDPVIQGCRVTSTPGPAGSTWTRPATCTSSNAGHSGVPVPRRPQQPGDPAAADRGVPVARTRRTRNCGCCRVSWSLQRQQGRELYATFTLPIRPRRTRRWRSSSPCGPSTTCAAQFVDEPTEQAWTAGGPWR